MIPLTALQSIGDLSGGDATSGDAESKAASSGGVSINIGGNPNNKTANTAMYVVAALAAVWVLSGRRG